MKCPCPLSVSDPRAKHNSVRLTVPCGKCPICLQNRRAEWSFRLTEELRTAHSARFLTLTIDDDNLIYNVETRRPELHKRHLTLFTKRLRKQITLHEGRVSKKVNKPLEPLKIRYYAVGEYGSKTNRPHYHAIYYNVPNEVIDNVQEIWQYGNTHVGHVTPASIHYVCKYVIQNFDHHDDRQKPFAVMSKGLGKNYLKRNDAWHVHNLAPYVIKDGFKQRMPRYYKDQIFTETEREKIAQLHSEIEDQKWINEYDKQLKRHSIENTEAIFARIKRQSKSN